MKNTILWGALVTLISSQIHADISHQDMQPQATTAAVPVNKDPTLPTIMNCDYKIPADIKNIEQTTVIAWAEKAVPQAFDFDNNAIDAQLLTLQTCFTDQGWQSFNTALQKSGNVEAIKSQKLSVSSQIDGKVELTDSKDNQWKINVPLQVVYQNEKEKVTQLLHLNVTIGRKVSGDLGIMQILATPRTENAQNQTTSTIPAEPASLSNNPTPTAPAQASTPTQPTSPSESQGIGSANPSATNPSSPH
ncbi:MAG: DotI/IcmL family type IV secretion protein [Legionellales bacterium]